MKPLSHSEYWLYHNDKARYYSQYILGIKEQPNRAMMLGSIFHSAMEKKDYDWKQSLIDKGYTPDYERNFEELLRYNFPDFPEKECWLGGKEYEETGCSLTGRADGRDKEKHIIYEIKTSSASWNQQQVNDNEQMTWYSFLHFKEFGQIPTVILFNCNVKNGKVKCFETKRTELQIKRLCADIRQVVHEIKKRGWWEARKSTLN